MNVNILTQLTDENSIFVIIEHAYLQLKWMEHQEKTQTSKATIVALPERGEYFSKFKNGWSRKEKQIEMKKKTKQNKTKQNKNKVL